MKKMKILAVVMLIAAALVAFAACSSGEEQPAGDDTQAETKNHAAYRHRTGSTHYGPNRLSNR